LFCSCRECRGVTSLSRSHPKDVIKLYADIAQAAYTESLSTARTLKLAVDAFLAKPTEDNFRAARATWIAARIPYMQTEAFRFGNAIVDDWEGRVNSWPLDEGLMALSPIGTYRRGATSGSQT
jgi:putative iron-regulated protein